METATEAIIRAQSDELAARRTADYIMHLLRDFIPDAAMEEAWDVLAKTAYNEGWELTDKAIRKEYEAWRKTQLDFISVMPRAGITE